MRTIVVTTFVTLDGVMQAPGGPDEDPTGGFAYGGWSVPAWDDVMVEAMTESQEEPYDILLGRKTYEIFAAHWPYADDPMADKLNSARKYVASHTLTSLDWQNSTLLDGDAVSKIRDLKSTDGPELRVLGSSELIKGLAAEGLIDEYGLWIYPVILGKGKRVFDDGLLATSLELVESKTSTTGVTIARYRRSGPVELGSAGFDEPTQAEVERRERLGA